MFLKQTMLVVALYTVALVFVLQTGNSEKIRLCGKKLADSLNFICEKHGGFHVPRIRREGKLCTCIVELFPDFF